MKKIILFLIVICCSLQVQAGSIEKIIFFGDSLSDNGNLYNLFLKQLPKSPPYFNGRFSNGKIWSETIGEFYNKRDGIPYSIYAVGGATVLVHMPSTKFISPSTLKLQVAHYILDSIFRDRSNVLFVIWIGGNDYLFDEKTNPEDVVNKMKNTMGTLIDRGAKNFLVLNLPDLAKTPRASAEGNGNLLSALSKSHNEKLAVMLAQMRNDHPDVKFHFMDIYTLFNDVIDNPEKYNKKYNTTIKNTKLACWTGGVTLQEGMNDQTFKQEWHRAALANVQSEASQYDAQLVENSIMKSPSLSAAYRVGKAYEKGATPCANPDEYLFWDEVHPSQSIHRVLSELVVEKLSQNVLR